MSRKLEFMRDVKGDMCRLGYLLIISDILKENEGYDESTLSRLLENITTIKKNPKWEKFHDGLSNTALIPKGAVSQNLVEFADKTDFFNLQKKSIGKNAKISRKIFSNILDSENPLVLSANQKIFLLKCLLEGDGISLLHLMEFLVDKSNLSRKEIIEYFMEEIYRQKILPYRINNSLNSTEKNKLEQELSDVNTWKAQREELEISQNWNTSELYSKYRHMANPRHEWLVDLGFLSKSKEKKFSSTNLASSLLESIQDWVNDEKCGIYEKIVPPYCAEIKIFGDKKQIKKEIVICFSLIRQAGNLATTKNFLIELVILRSLLEKKLMIESNVRGCLEELISKFPNYVREMSDPYGKKSIVRIKDDFKIEMLD